MLRKRKCKNAFIGISYVVIAVIMMGCNNNSQSEISNSMEYNPMANPKAIVTSENVRFTILTPNVIRMEYSEQNKFEDHASLLFVNRDLPVPQYTKKEESGKLIIETEALSLEYIIGSGVFDETNLTIDLHTGDMKKTWYPGLINEGNLRGTMRTLDGFDGDSSTYRKKRVQLEEGILSKDGWVLIDDSERPLFDDSDWAWVMPRDSNNHKDFYFFGYGYNFKKALKDFTAVAGKIALPPRYVFGYWFSRWHPFTEMEFRELVDQFETLNIPLDVLVIDMDWHITGLPEFFKDGKRTFDQVDQYYGWTGFTWNKSYFPEPKEFLKWTNEKGLKTCLNLHPASGFHPHEEQYEMMARNLNINTDSGKHVPFDIVNKSFAKLYFDSVLHPMEKAGIDFWWLDWQQWNTTNIPGVNPTFYMNYVHYSDMKRQGKRPLIYHRWGGLGNHRYQIGFSGDTKITWKSLNYQPYFTATASNVGFGFWGNDVGGFYGNRNSPEMTDPELFARWFQFGIFSPIVKTHATCYEPIKRKIWEYPHEYFLHLRELVQLRYALIPYIYNAARQSYNTGISLCRPMYYDYPRSDNAYFFKNQYMFGDDMIIHPITYPMGEDSLYTIQNVWLPEGQWFEWSSGKILNGEDIYNQPFLETEIPVYVKAGAIVPMQAKGNNASDQIDHLIVNIFPGEYGELELYEDNGNDNGFETNEYSLANIEFEKSGSEMNIKINPAIGKFKGMLTEKSYEIRLVNSFPPKSITINGKTIPFNEASKHNCWNYDGQNLTTRIYLPSKSIKRSHGIEIKFIEGDLELLQGTKQKLKYAFEFSKFLANHRNFWRQSEWNDAYYPSDKVMALATTAIKLNQQPENIVEIITMFNENYKEVIKMIEGINKEHRTFKPYGELLKAVN